MGGIWTVITSKSRTMKHAFGDKYLTIGFHNPDSIEIVNKKVPDWLASAFRELEPLGLKFQYGDWVDATSSKIVLIDSTKFQNQQINQIKQEMWNNYKIDSLDTKFDFNEPLAWSYATGMLIESITKTTSGKGVAHFHEWLSGAGLLYLNSKQPSMPTIFTTHATVLGRSVPMFDSELVDTDQLARDKGVLAKHQTEKAAASASDVFTTVSDLTAEEAARILGRKPDVLTYNALDSKLNLQNTLRKKILLRDRLNKFLKGYFTPYYPIQVVDMPVIYTAGRYEFHNKGFDIFIDALGKLNEQLKQADSDRTILSFIMVPAGTLGFKDEVVDNFVIYQRMREMINESMSDLASHIHTLAKDDDVIEGKMNEIMIEMKRFSSRFKSRRGKNPPLCASRLANNEEQDPVLSRMRQVGLLNRKEDRVKSIFYPIYLNRQDELLGMSYFEFITAGSMGVFPSRYEPWGYTTMESAASISSAVTTDRSGFGRAVKGLGGLEGITVLESGGDIVDRLAIVI
ncbi:MAG: hypothetical protein GOU99_02175, partial [Candidatus Altiarchaeota archaeon]|nr:hypothetical protein [Candidatus Altiarchaeota archaeon]